MVILKYLVLFVAGVGTATVGCTFLAKRQIGRLAKLFLAAIGSGMLLIFYSCVIEPNWIEITHLKIKDPALAGVLKNIKIVHLTDIHLNNGIGFREKKLIEKVNQLNPDIIFFTGDLIDDLTQIPAGKEIFSKLKARVGIFGVAGDTDHIVIDTNSLAKELAPAGISFLNNESRKVWLDDTIYFWLVGLDDANSPAEHLDRALMSVPQGVPNIVIAPGPQVFERVAKSQANLLLVGDTHGGQIGIPFLIHMSEYANRSPYMEGFFQKGHTAMYVNRGIGTKTIPARFLCRPEIAVIEITGLESESQP